VLVFPGAGIFAMPVFGMAASAFNCIMQLIRRAVNNPKVEEPIVSLEP
jgi:hypothetical protein